MYLGKYQVTHYVPRTKLIIVAPVPPAPGPEIVLKISDEWADLMNRGVRHLTREPVGIKSAVSFHDFIAPGPNPAPP